VRIFILLLYKSAQLNPRWKGWVRQRRIICWWYPHGFLRKLTRIILATSTMPPPKLYAFSSTIGEGCARQMVSFHDLASKLNMDVVDVMRQANAKAPPSRTLVKGLAKELGIDEGFLEKLAVEVRRDLGPK
jgi:hypothetical protein